jgi:4-oxalocrotonate tautomerase
VKTSINLEALMPYINIKLSIEPSEAVSRKVASALTDLTAELLKKKREVTSVVVEYVSPASWFVGAAALAEHGGKSAYLEVNVTKGTNTKDEKAAYLAQAFKALEEILGALHPASYAVIHEIDADAWGYQGRTQEHRFIAGRMQ